MFDLPLSDLQIGLRTPITFPRLDLNYIVVFNYTSNKLDPCLLSLLKIDTFLEPGPASWVKSGTKKRLLACDVPVLIKKPGPGLNKYSTK